MAYGRLMALRLFSVRSESLFLSVCEAGQAEAEDREKFFSVLPLLCLLFLVSVSSECCGCVLCVPQPARTPSTPTLSHTSAKTLSRRSHS